MSKKELRRIEKLVDDFFKSPLTEYVWINLADGELLTSYLKYESWDTPVQYLGEL